MKSRQNEAEQCEEQVEWCEKQVEWEEQAEQCEEQAEQCEGCSGVRSRWSGRTARSWWSGIGAAGRWRCVIDCIKINTVDGGLHITRKC